MARFSEIICLILLVLTTCAIADIHNLEKQVQLLAEKYEILAAKDMTSEAKISQLENEVAQLTKTVEQQAEDFLALKSQRINSANQVNRQSVGKISGMPKSCSDLAVIGHTLSGLYSITGTKEVDTVYCDFTKLLEDPGYQIWIGSVAVKSLPTYFYVQKGSANFNLTNVPIPFEVDKLNIGGAMNLTSGVFTAPRTGNYFFSVSGIGSFPFGGRIDINLVKNGGVVGSGYAGNSDGFDTFSIHSILDLSAEDKIWVQLATVSEQAYLYNNKYTHFTGWLLSEDVQF